MKIIGDGGHAKVVRELMVLIHVNAEAENRYFFVAVGDNAARKREADRLHMLRPSMPLIHPDATVSHSAIIGDGSVIMAGAIVQAGAVIGKHCILNTGCSVDHDAILGDYVHIAPGAHICGGVYIGDGTLVGVGVGIAPNARIPAWTLLKARRIELEQQQQPVQGHSRV